MKDRRFLFLLAFCLLAVSCAHNTETFYFGDYSQAEQLYNKGRYEKAIQKYQAYMDENPEGNLSVISQYYMAKSHAALGHLDEARKMYQDIISQHKDLVWANFSETQLKTLENPSTPVPKKG